MSQLETENQTRQQHAFGQGDAQRFLETPTGGVVKIQKDNASKLFTGLLQSSDDKIQRFGKLIGGPDTNVELNNANFSKMLHLEREHLIQQWVKNTGQTTDIEQLKAEVEKKKNEASNKLQNVQVKLENKDVNVIMAIDELHARYQAAQSADQKREISLQISQIYSSLDGENARTLLEYRAATELLSRIETVKAAAQSAGLKDKLSALQSFSMEIPTDNGPQRIEANSPDQLMNALLCYYLQKEPNRQIDAVVNNQPISFARHVQKQLAQVIANNFSEEPKVGNDVGQMKNGPTTEGEVKVYNVEDLIETRANSPKKETKVTIPGNLVRISGSPLKTNHWYDVKTISLEQSQDAKVSIKAEVDPGNIHQAKNSSETVLIEFEPVSGTLDEVINALRQGTVTLTVKSVRNVTGHYNGVKMQVTLWNSVKYDNFGLELSQWKQLSFLNRDGINVDEVTRNSVAEKCGLQRGEVILGILVKNHGEKQQVIRLKRPEDLAAVAYLLPPDSEFMFIVRPKEFSGDEEHVVKQIAEYGITDDTKAYIRAAKEGNGGFKWLKLEQLRSK